MNATETKQDKTKSNGTKPAENQTDQTKSPLFFEVPLPTRETLQCLTAYMQDERHMKVTAVSFRKNGDMLLVGVLPETAV